MQKVAMSGIFVIMKLFSILIVMVVILIDPDDKMTYNCVEYLHSGISQTTGSSRNLQNKLHPATWVNLTNIMLSEEGRHR